MNSFCKNIWRIKKALYICTVENNNALVW